MPAGDLERLERERQQADREYNDALTALDAALIRSAPSTVVLADPVATAPPLPGGWRGRWLRAVEQWLAPWFERQRAFDAAAAQAIRTLAASERERSAAFERFQSALIVLLQHVTAFVESKDRQIDSASAGRLDAQQQTLDTLPDLRAQVAILQRATHMLTRMADESKAPQPPMTTPTPTSAAGGAAGSPEDYKYVAFEDQFRGSVDDIRAKLAEYLPIFQGASDVLDVGCGRGEFLALLKAAGVSARGVDLNDEMVAEARGRGLDAVAGDALTHLSSLADESIGGFFAAQVVEHLEPGYLIRLLETAFHKLKPGAPLVIETINPACWLAFFSSYLRDLTHVRAIHPETLEYLTRASGFERVMIRYSAPVAEHTRMQSIDLPTDVLGSSEPAVRALVDAARVVNVNAAILNRLAFSFHDYAVIGFRS